ncbi:MAG TPA: hypothetical protein PLH94_13620 [Fimbriimonadaceae bacterium]|nr:hypothetical protein [Fimbriimonadaceae bacterium]
MKTTPFLLAVAVVAIVLAAGGCGPKEPSSGTASGPIAQNDAQGKADPGMVGGETAGSEPGSQSPKADPSKPGEPKGASPDKPKANSPDSPPPKPNIQVVPPKTSGWGATTLTLPALGKKIDQTMAGSKKLYGEATLYVDNGELAGSVNSTIQVKDRTKYSIEYHLPKDPTTTNKLVGNGTKRVMFEDDKWTPQPKTSVEVDTWLQTFPREIFAGVTELGTPWTQLLEELSAGKGGFKAQVEERTVKSPEGTKRYFRVVATRGGENPAEFEARFDADHFLPLAVRVVDSRNGKTIKSQWQARWTWTKPLDDKAFAIPGS